MDKVFEIESYEIFQVVLHQIIRNISYNSTLKLEAGVQLDHSELIAAGEDLRKIITNCNFDMKKVFESLSNKTEDKERVKYVLTLLSQEKTKVVYASVVHHNSELGETITHSDWLLKLVLGTSELNTMKYPLLQLILSTVNTSGVKSNKMFELNKSMVLKTLRTLEQLTGDIKVFNNSK